MRSLLRFLRCLWIALAWPALAADVLVAPADFQLAAATGRRVTLTPEAARGTAGLITTIEPRSQTVTNSSVTFSNSTAGTYRLDISGAPPTALRILVPDTNGQVNAASILVTSTNATEAAATVAWSAAASDARYASQAELDALAAGVSDTPISAVDSRDLATPVTLNLPTPDGLPTVTHPNVIVTSSNAILAYTPYPDAPREKCMVAYSTDLINWHLNAGAPSPIIAISEITALMAQNWASSWTADGDIYLEPSGVLHLLCTAYITRGSSSNLQCLLLEKSTLDRTNWSALHLLRDFGTNINARIAGPQIVADAAGALRLYYVDDNSLYPTNALIWVPSADGTCTNWNWGAPTICALQPYAPGLEAPWHFDLVYVDSLYRLFYCGQSGGQGEYSESTDGTTWDAPKFGLLSMPGLLQPGAGGGYKPAMVPISGPPLRYNMFLGTFGTNLVSPGATNLGWRIRLLRDVQWPPDRYGQAVDTNMFLIGAANTTLLSSRPGRLVVQDNSISGGGSTVAMGTWAAGYAGIGFTGTNLSANSYALAGDRTITILSVPGSGTLRFAQGNGARMAIGTGGGVTVGLTANNTLTNGQLHTLGGLSTARTNAYTVAELGANGVGLWNSNGVGNIFLSVNMSGVISNKLVVP